jgi:hypothetical protein
MQPPKSSEENPWAGAELKLEEARRAFEEMGRPLQPPERTQNYAAQAASGAIVDNRWQDRFYSGVSTFLEKVRSVPSITEACFGKDLGHPRMKTWFDRLPEDEQRRRKDFSNQFKGEQKKKSFDEHYLTNERNVSQHRLGFADIKAEVIGQFGTKYTATPTTRIPTAEMRPLEPNINEDPALQWAATQPPRPIEPPRWDQWKIGEKPLFSECRAYLTLAEEVVQKARAIADRVHGTEHLEAPPAT